MSWDSLVGMDKFIVSITAPTEDKPSLNNKTLNTGAIIFPDFSILIFKGEDIW